VWPPRETVDVSGPGKSPRSEGERLIAAYLRQRRLPWVHEPDIGGRNLDFLAETAVGHVALEVYEPELRLPNGAGAFDYIAAVEGLFAQRKLKQIKAAKSAGLPLILVVGSANSDIPLDLFAMEGLMFGRPGVRFPLDSPDPGADAEWTFLGAGRIQPRLNRGVSALALVRRFNPTQWRLERAWRSQRLLLGDAPNRRAVVELYGRMRAIETELVERGVYDPAAAVARLVILHNPHADHPLDKRFAGPHDDQYGVVELDDGRVVWGCLAFGLSRWEVLGDGER